MPELRAWRTFGIAKSLFIGMGPNNITYNHLKAILVAEPNAENEFRGLPTERRNIEHLLFLCRGNGIELILSTFAFYQHRLNPDREESRYAVGVTEENEMLRSVSKQHGLRLADAATLIPKTDSFFLD